MILKNALGHTALAISIFLMSSELYAQVIYMEMCNVPCEACKPEKPTRVEYRADPKKNLVMRIYGGTDVYMISDCIVFDKDNWACDGYGQFKQYGKQFAINGVAHWTKGIPSSDPTKVNERICTFDKNILGEFRARN